MILAKVTSRRDVGVEAVMAESRLSRWSRLKQKGGADEREQTEVEKAREVEKQAVAEAEPETFNLPGGVRVRHFVPAMAPLAPEPEDDDDRLTRGIGHSDNEGNGGEPDVQALQDGPDDEEEMAIGAFDAQDDLDRDIYAGIVEQELTDEQKEVVSTLPPLESLSGESDFTPFMREGVPEFIKKKAMRLLWRANPLFSFRDEMNDYDEDYNVVHQIIDSSFGSYQVGRGHLSEEELQNMMPEEAKRAFDEDEEENEEELTEEAKLSEEAENEEVEAEETTAGTETAIDQTSAEQPDISEEIDDENGMDIDDEDDLIH
jgi:hypothetical protein